MAITLPKSNANLKDDIIRGCEDAQINTAVSGDVFYINIIITDENKINQLSDNLSEKILELYEKNFIKSFIHDNYDFFTPDERKKIVNNVFLHMNDSSAFLKENRKKIIYNKVYACLIQYDEFVLDGFLRFRLKDYSKQLLDVINQTVDEFIVDKEYHEFIGLLKYFVTLQEPQLEEIHIIVDCKGSYTLRDNDNNLINSADINGMLEEAQSRDLTPDDLLVSTLITLSPMKIILHGSENIKNRELFETIKNVFEDRFIICMGCKICSAVKHNSESALKF